MGLKQSDQTHRANFILYMSHTNTHPISKAPLIRRMLFLKYWTLLSYCPLFGSGMEPSKPLNNQINASPKGTKTMVPNAVAFCNDGDGLSHMK